MATRSSRLLRDSTDSSIVYLYYHVCRIFAALLLALITLFTNYTHVDLLGAASVDLPQQAGIPCIAAAVAMAVAEAQLTSNDRRRRGALRDRAEAVAEGRRSR